MKTGAARRTTNRLPLPLPSGLEQDENAAGAKKRVKAHAWPKEPKGHYVEEPWVSELMFKAAPPPRAATILDPCAGFGHIPAAARRLGYRAIGSDLVKRSPSVIGGLDFLAEN